MPASEGSHVMMDANQLRRTARESIKVIDAQRARCLEDLIGKRQLELSTRKPRLIIDFFRKLFRLPELTGPVVSRAEAREDVLDPRKHRSATLERFLYERERNDALLLREHDRNVCLMLLHAANLTQSSTVVVSVSDAFSLWIVDHADIVPTVETTDA